MSSAVTRLEKIANATPMRDNYSGEDPDYKGIVSSTSDNNGRRPDLNKNLYNRDVSDDATKRVAGNSKRYGAALYLGKEGNKDMYAKREGVEGYEAFMIHNADSAKDKMERSTISDYAKQSGINNAMKEMNEEGIKMTSQISGFIDTKARNGGDNAVITMLPEDGTMTKEQRDRVLEILKRNGVVQSNISQVEQAELEKDPNSKKMFTKEHLIENKEVMDMVAGSKGGKLSVPKVERNEDDGMNDKEGATSSESNGKKEKDKNTENVSVDHKAIRGKTMPADGRYVDHDKGADSSISKRLMRNDSTMEKYKELDEMIKLDSKDKKAELKNGKVKLTNLRNGKTEESDMNAEMADAFKRGKKGKKGNDKFSEDDVNEPEKKNGAKSLSLIEKEDKEEKENGKKEEKVTEKGKKKKEKKNKKTK